MKEKTGLDLKGDEVLIDIPRFGKKPEVDLRVFFGQHLPFDRVDPLSFDDPEVSLLKDSLIGNFEAQAKVVRIFCIDEPDLTGRLREGGADLLLDLSDTTERSSEGQA
jgi:hypothetical protein